MQNNKIRHNVCNHLEFPVYIFIIEKESSQEQNAKNLKQQNFLY